MIELIKNAYDADATSVLVAFSGPLRSGKGQIVVLDNGTGITPTVLREVWLEPATPNRLRRVRTQEFRRRVLGEKGIGRFAAARLSSLFELTSRSIGSSDEVFLTIDWSSFEEDNYLDEVQVSWSVRSPEVFRKGGVASQLWSDVSGVRGSDRHGTLLVMTNLRSSWEKSDLERLRVDLSRLVSPFPLLEEGGSGTFDIFLQVPKPFAELSGRITPPEELKFPRYSLRARVSGDGRARLSMTLPGKRQLSRTKQLDVDVARGTCGPIELELRVWDRDSAALDEIASRMGSTTRDVRQVLDHAAGVSVYRDGFRVLPYGEAQNDWLRLDARRVQNPTLRLSNNQLVGYVLIGAETNPQLRDQTNREGLIQGPAFDALRDFVVAALAELEQLRFEFRRERPAAGLAGRGLFDEINVNRIAKFVRSKYPDDARLAAIVGSQQRFIDRGIERVREVLARYVRYAALGLVVDGVIHDTAEPVGAIVSESQLALDRVRERSKDGSVIGRFAKSFELIGNQAKLVARVLDRIAPFGGRKRGRPKKIVLEKAIAAGCDLLSAQVTEQRVGIELPQSKTLVTADPVEIQEIILNLLNNSIYWLRNTPASRRRVRIEVSRTQNGVEILFADNGPGVDPSVRDRIFEPYFSTKPDGSGLGLTIVGDLVTNYYDGELELVDDGPLPGATFRLILRRRV